MKCQGPQVTQDQMAIIAMEGEEEEAVVEGLVGEEEMALMGVAQEGAEGNPEGIQMQDLSLARMGEQLKFIHHIIFQPTSGM